MTPEPESYQARLDHERAETRKRYEELYTGVLAAMQSAEREQWTIDNGYDPDNDHRYQHERMKFVNKTNPEMRFDLAIQHHHSSKPAIIRVSGWWPQIPSGPATASRSYGPMVTPRDVQQDTPSINCSLSKGHTAIARDIERRFLPAYKKVFGLCVEYIAKQVSYADRKTANWARLTAIPGVKAHTYRPEAMTADIKLGADFDAGYGEVQMSTQDSCEIKLRSVPIDRAEAILKAILSARK